MKNDSKASSIETRHLEGSIVETVYSGRIIFDGALDRDLQRYLREYPGMCWLVDATRVTGIDPRRRESAGDTIGIFRRGGGRAIAAAIPLAPVRMVASALAFGFDLPLNIFASRAEALAYLRSL